jgi:alpha-tubulin suppressor-like RCC1 family protein
MYRIIIIACVIVIHGMAHSEVQAASATSVDVGWDHACAITSGQVWCWGANVSGQLGDKSNTLRTGAVRAKKNNNNNLANVTSLATGGFHTCAITSGQVWCWGANASGQLGNRANTNMNGAVRAVKNNGNQLSNVTAIAAGSYHTCAITSGQVWCWGSNSYGQLGNTNTDNKNGAVRAKKSDGSVLANVTAIAAGAYHTCAITNRQVWCWGANASGQLGNNTILNSYGATRTKTSASAFLTGATKIAAGGSTSCAVTTKVLCWGNNQYGQVGNKSTVNQIVAQSALQSNSLTINDAVKVDVGAFHTCVARRNGKTNCWGENSYGALGNRTRTNSSFAVLAQKNNNTAFSSATTVAAGAYSTCAITSGQVWCWGINSSGNLGDNTKTTRTGAVRTKYGSGAVFP